VPGIFADTAYYIALLTDSDDLHVAARDVGRSLGATAIVTTDAVLVEVFAYFAGRGRHQRMEAVELVALLGAAPNVTLIHQSAGLFFAGVDLYRRRQDKEYSLTDCMSMVACREQGITDVLTHDRHFEQEGFAILL
jgi:predicted nucleic acid-binding protein